MTAWVMKSQKSNIAQTVSVSDHTHIYVTTKSSSSVNSQLGAMGAKTKKPSIGEVPKEIEKIFNSKKCIDLREDDTLKLTFDVFNPEANIDETMGMEGSSMTSIEDAKDKDKSITRKVISTTHFFVQVMKTH